jgi:predicted dehydrogenase
MTAEGRARLRWGVLGTGGIAHKFAAGMAASETGTLLAVGSRTQESAERFGDLCCVARRYPSYDAVLADPDVQAVYIALPNSMHAAWAIKAARAGKHILCEKPLTTNAAEAARVIEEVRRHDVFLLEASLYRCHPQTARLDTLLREGVIGDVRLIECRFSFDLGSQGPNDNIRLSNPLAGGGIMDVGCYVASLALLVAGEPPVDVTGLAHIGAESRVDEWAMANLRFPGGALASLVCGTRVASERALTVWGAEGSIHVSAPWKPASADSRIVMRRKGMEPEEIAVDKGGDIWAQAVDTVARYIPDRQVPRPGMTWADSLDTMRVLDHWRQAVGLVFDGE